MCQVLRKNTFVTKSPYISDKVFKYGPSKICGIQLKRFEGVCSVKTDHITSSFLKAVFHKFYLSILEYFVSGS